MHVEAGKSGMSDAFSSARAVELESGPRADWLDLAIDHSLIEAVIKVEALERLIPWVNAGPASRACMERATALDVVVQQGK